MSDTKEINVADLERRVRELEAWVETVREIGWNCACGPHVVCCGKPQCPRTPRNRT